MESPITTFCDTETGMIPNELAGACNLTFTRYQLLVQGAYSKIPSTLRQLADEIRGPGGADRLEADYQAFRSSLPFDTRLELDRQLFPGGHAFGMCN
ncbi:MAG: hypothetical protein VB050_13235 [Geobacteraceae bacterium]|nr:hypothetical protein [Geobacteraceae bacterium]